MTITRTRLFLSLGLATVGALVWASGASAKTLGSLAPPGPGGCVSCDMFQTKTAVGEPKYRVPKGPTGLWTITSWSAQGSPVDGAARLSVYRRTATNGQFELVKQSALETVPANQHPSFTTSVDVKKGDLLGIFTSHDVSAGYNTSFTDDVNQILTCNPTGVGQLVGTGSSCPLAVSTGDLVNVDAQLSPR